MEKGSSPSSSNFDLSEIAVFFHVNFLKNVELANFIHVLLFKEMWSLFLVLVVVVEMIHI